MTDLHARVPVPGEEALRGRVDRSIVIAHLAVPLGLASFYTGLLAEGWSWTVFATVLPFFAFGLRPAVWSVLAGSRSRGKAARARLLERRDNSANTALIAMAVLGLAIMDVFRLPGAPHWTNQPDAGLMLAGVAVYLVWLATYARVPVEVRAGWAGLFGRKETR